MTERTVIECDWKDCEETEPSLTDGAVPPDWGILTDSDGRDRHLCELHAHRAVRWACAGVSEGDAFDEVRHKYVGHDDLPDRVYAHGDTLGMSIMPVIDEPPTTFEEFDPPLGCEGQDTEAFGFHVFDHLHVYVIGGHKQEPLVVVDSDEFLTRVEVRDSQDSFGIDGVAGINLDGDAS